MKILGARPFDYIAPFVMMIFTIVYMATAYTYKPVAAQFPLIVSWATVVLLVLDLLSRTKTPVGTAVNLWLNGSAHVSAMREEDQVVPLRRQIAALLWVAGFVACMIAIGILYAVPIYVFAFMRLFGERKWFTCTLTAVGVAIFVYAMFVLFLSVDLFPGILFGGEM